MIHPVSTLQTFTYSSDLTMGNVLKRLSYTFNDDSRFLICGTVALLGVTPIATSFHFKSLYLHLWRSCSSWLRRTVSQSILNIFGRLQSTMLYLRSLSHSRSPYTYMTPEMEEMYWKRAAAGHSNLQRSDARYLDAKGTPLRDGMLQLPPLVMSYTPALLPGKQKIKKAKKLKRHFISAKDYCKWHRMVFPGDDHPTLAAASRLRKMHDPEELQEIHRISRMLPDDEVFPRQKAQARPWTPKYQRKWQRWRTSHREALEKL